MGDGSVKRIGILADTHGRLREEILGALQTCDVILHAGDVNKPEIIERLQEIAPVYVVRGNNDKEWAEQLPMDLTLELYGFRFYMIHIVKMMKLPPEGVDFVVFGHSHKYEDREKDGMRYLNPGSCGPRRFHQEITMMIMTIQEADHTWQVEKIDCSPVLEETPDMPKLSQADMKHLIREMIKDIDTGRSVERIARKNRVSKEFAEQVCRMYLTHPGIDLDGILERIELRGLYRK